MGRKRHSCGQNMKVLSDKNNKIFRYAILTFLALISLYMMINNTGATSSITPDYLQKDHHIAARSKDTILPAPDIFGIPARGKLLIAGKTLQDPRFRETVVFLIECNATGAVGLIINRPTIFRLADIINDMPAIKKRQDVAFYGGPVESNRMFLLIRSTNLIAESFKVMEEVNMSTSRSVLERIISGKLTAPFKSYAGYAGWAPGQLDAEIAHGDWFVTNADARIIFEHDPKTLWPELIRGIDSIKVQQKNSLAALPLLSRFMPA